MTKVSEVLNAAPNQCGGRLLEAECASEAGGMARSQQGVEVEEAIGGMVTRKGIRVREVREVKDDERESERRNRRPQRKVEWREGNEGRGMSTGGGTDANSC